MPREAAMTLKRFLIVFFVGVLAEAGVFALYYDDLLYLRLSVPEITSAPLDTFQRHATSALERERLTRQHLETMADAAKGFGLHDIEVRALARRAAEDPADVSVRLRLGDALRRSGAFDKAEAVYRDILESAPREVAP
jgi:hypothetical protein